MELTASNTNSKQDKKAGAMSVSEGLPSAKMANVMCPAKETESTVAWERKVQREMRAKLGGVRLLSDWRQYRISSAK